MLKTVGVINTKVVPSLVFFAGKLPRSQVCKNNEIPLENNSIIAQMHNSNIYAIIL